SLDEVEGLYRYLASLPHSPSEVHIYTPNMAHYAPLIEAIFGEKVPHQLLDLPLCSTSPLIDAIRRVLFLNQERFSREALFPLFSLSSFQKKWGIDAHDVSKLFELCEGCGVTWGCDSTHCQSLGFPDEGSVGRWETAFDMLLRGLAKEPEEGPFAPPSVPLAISDSLSGMIQSIRMLRESLDPFLASHSLIDWSRLIHNLIIHVFDLSEKEKIAMLPVFRALESLDRIGTVQREPLPFSALLPFFESLFLRGGEKRNKEGEAYLFRGWESPPTLPCRALCLIGMDDQSFPQSKGALQKEREEAIWVQVLMTPQDSLFISYSGKPRESLPATPVAQLTNILDISPQIPSKERVRPFPPPAINPQEVALPEEISLRDLKASVTHPTRFYCQKQLRWHLPYPDEGEAGNVLSPLTRYHLEAGASAEEAASLNQLPGGRLGEIALGNVQIAPSPPSFSLPFLHKTSSCFLSGRIEGLTEEGMLCPKDRWIPQWPGFLLLSLLPDSPVPPYLLLSTGPICCPPPGPHYWLNKLLAYYQQALSFPLPFLPNWLPWFHQQKIERIMSSHNTSRDPYLTWSSHQELESLKPSFWKELICNTFPSLDILNQGKKEIDFS
ncbi:MAG: hypothetical protein VXZ72_02120, partial [Chlamydiota bacterium]|nr:hypothetical protein [Chlamydiota bacterium]